MDDRPDRIRPMVPLIVLLAGATIGMGLGAATNLVNGWVSLFYFYLVMGIAFDHERVVLQGVLEGGILGAVFGIVVAISLVASTGARGSVGLALGALWRACVAAMACWALGGVCGVGFAAMFPEAYDRQFSFGRGVWGANWAPPATRDRLGYAWVGGSIWGAYAGTVVGAIVAAVFVHRRWRRGRGAVGFEVVTK